MIDKKAINSHTQQVLLRVVLSVVLAALASSGYEQ
jgi:hypothetical protein